MASIESELASLQRIHERIQSTKNEDLGTLLTLLIPRLVLLTNQEALRVKSMSVLSECMKRIKLAIIPLNISKLIDCVQAQHLPFAPNLAITFIDIAVEHSKALTNAKEAVESLSIALPQFDAFTNASNSLCSYALLHFSDGVYKHFESMPVSELAKQRPFQSVLGDFALDICFLQRTLLAGEISAVGSVQPGLSVSRLERLISKRKSWTAADLKAIKLALINLIPSRAFLAHHTVLISVVLSHDVDADVAAQATYKMNGCVNMLGIDKVATTATEVCTAVLALCSADEVAQKETPVAHRRSMVKAEVRLGALRWLCRHLPLHVAPSAKPTLMVVFRSVFNPAAQASGVSVASSLTEEVAVVGASLQLLESVLQQVDDKVFAEMVLLVNVCLKKILQSFAYTTSSFSAGEHHTIVRSSCYRIAETVAQRYVARSKELTAQCVEELALHDAASEEAPLQPTESIQEQSTALSAAVTQIKTAVEQLAKVTVEDAELLMLLFQLLDREHAQRNESSIIALYRAMNALREAFLLVQQPPVLSAGVAAASTVRANGLNLVTTHKLQELLRSVRRSDKDIKMRLAALQWSRALFHWDAFVLDTMFLLADDPNEAVSAAAVAEFARLKTCLCGPLDASTTENNITVLMSLLEQIVEVSGLPAEGSAESSYIGLHLLLDVAACALHQLSNTGSLARLPFPLLSKVLQAVAKVPLLRPLGHSGSLLADKGQEVYFTSLRASTAVSSQTAEPVVENVLQQEADRKVKKNELGKVKATAISAPLLRSVSSITHIIVNMVSADDAASLGAVLAVCKRHLPQYLVWLTLPEFDIRHDVSRVIAAVCTSTSDGTSVDLNELFTLTRQLFLKLSSASAATITSDATTSSQAGSGGRSASGAICVLGSIVEQLVHLVSRTAADVELRTETQRMLDQLLTQCVKSMKLDATASLDICLMQVTALEVLILLSKHGFLVPATAGGNAGELFRCSQWEEIKCCVKLLIHNADYRCAVPALEAYTNLCTTPAVDSAGLVWEFWSELMLPDLRLRENQCVKFAWAEAIVQLCALPITTADLCACDASAAATVQALASTLRVEDAFGQVATITPLLMYLLHLIDVSVKNSEQGNVAERSTYCVTLLVLIKRCAPGKIFPKAITKLILELLLKFMKEKDLFIQDVCCMSLCHLYDTADRTTVTETAVMAGLAGQSVTVAEYIAQEVTVALTREKRAIQPAGYNVGATSPAASRAPATTATTNAAPAETGAVAGGGGGAPPPRDDAHLLQAAVAAAAELGVGLRFSSGTEEISASQTEQLPQDYVVYSTICKLAKVGKDQSILFAVLALIKRDPTFGAGPSRALQLKYASPSVHFPTQKLVEMLPMLYHARFDPNTTVKPVMRALWDTLLDKHFPQQQHLQLDLIQRRVVSFLCQKLQSSQWRDREASCLALEAFLPRRTWEVSVFPLLEDLFNSALRVLDDMRDSTRGAAISFTKALSSHIVRACNPEEASETTVSSTIGKILPLLLEKGLVAPSAEARGVSLGLLGKVVEAAKTAPALRKWLAQIISVLIEGMSALEPQTLQYMQFHTARLRISEEELEAMRIKMAQSSPLQEALEICLTCLHNATFYDTTTSLIPDVMQGLCAQLQRGVGLATRAAAAQALSQMAERYPLYLGKGTSGAKSASEAFRSIIWSLTQAPHMAVTLKKAMTSAFGALSKVVDEEVLASECVILVTRYCSLERDQLDQSVVLAQCIQQIVQRGGQRMEDGAENRNAMWDRILSCAYLGSHDGDADSKAVWTATWQEALSTSGAGTKLGVVLRTLPLLLAMVKTMYEELSWHRRVQAVQVFREIIEILPAETLQIEFAKVSALVADLLSTLLLSIPGQVWGGQAVVLDVISELLAKNKTHINFAAALTNTADEIVVLECSEEKDRLRLDKLTSPYLCQHMLDGVAAPVQHEAPSADPESPSWRLNFFGWALVLVHESRRGARNNSSLAEYRLAAARALSLLPWVTLCSTPEGTATFGRLLPVLCKQSNIPPFAKVAITDPSSSTAVGGQGVDAAAQQVDSSRRSNKRTLGSAALFGVRYSMKDSHARQRPDQVVSGSEVSSITLEEQEFVNEDAQEDEAEEGMMDEQSAMQVEGEEGNTKLPAEAMDTDVGLTESAVDAALGITTAATDSPMLCDADAAHSSAPDAPAADGLIQAESVLKHQPAYHVFYIDSLLRAWPREVCPSPTQEALLMDCVLHILVWAETVMRTEVWSVRKAAVQLVGTVSNSRPLSPLQCAATLRVIELAISEQKFVKVRVEALKSLALLLQSCNRAHVDKSEELKTRVRELIRSASTDSQPTILEAVAKVQNVWLR